MTAQEATQEHQQPQAQEFQAHPSGAPQATAWDNLQMLPFLQDLEEEQALLERLPLRQPELHQLQMKLMTPSGREFQ